MKTKLRDRFVAAVSNYLANNVASDEYRALLYLCYMYGKRELDNKLGVEERNGVLIKKDE